MEKKRVALVLSGGVSLGSYIAGALDELLRLMALDGGYEIDVITGASAGATTAAIIAHGLLYRGEETLLHHTWVDQIDIVDLLDPEISPDTPLSLLSNRRLCEIARQSLALPEGHTLKRSTLCADQLKLAVTITNLDGLSYESRVLMQTDGIPEPFIQDRYAEQETFLLYKRTQPDDPVWQRIAVLSLASAALPLVFPPIPIRRTLNSHEEGDEPGWKSSLQYIQPPVIAPEDKHIGTPTFLYADGGLFNNLPVDLAWHYIRENDTGAADGNRRIIIIIDPSKDMIRRIDSGSAVERAAYRNPLVYLTGLVGAMRSESSAIQFQREVLRARVERSQASGAQPALPGIDRPGVELLEHVALVLPRLDEPRLIGSYLVYALAAFLDRTFREYDFRRGAADARRVAHGLLNIDKEVERPGEPLFYTPDNDPRFIPYPTSYNILRQIDSSRFPGHSIQKVLEARLRKRLAAVIRHFPLLGPWWVRALIASLRYPLSWLLPAGLVRQLDRYW